jgi:EmrB/QacA subfamily drug resistance transporter
MDTSVNRTKVLMGVMLAIMLSSLDQTIVSSALPRIVADLNGVSYLSWIFTAYMLAATMTVPIFGKLSDLMGRRGMYLIAILIFLIGSILAGAAQSMGQLIFFRGLQGIGGGAMMVSAVATIADIIPPAQRGKYQGIIGGAFGVSSILGPFLGGWISHYFSWRWIFYINIPLAGLAFFILATALPRMPRVARVSVDYRGAGWLSLSLLSFLLVLVWGGSLFNWVSFQTLGLLGLSGMALVRFIRTELSVSDPIMTLALFKNKAYTLSILLAFLTAMGMYGAIMFIPFFAQGVLWMSPSNAGMMMIPMMLGLVLSSIVGGQITARTGKYKHVVMLGILTSTFALWRCSMVGVHTTSTELVTLLAILGAGLGATFPIINLVVQSAVSRSRIGEVTAGVQLFRSLGGTIGTALLGGVLNMKMQDLVDSLKTTPFVENVGRVFPDSGFATLDVDLVQKSLTFPFQTALIERFQSLSVFTREDFMSTFPRYLDEVREGYSIAVDQVFWVSTIIMCVAVVVVFLLPEIPLRGESDTV